MTSGEGMAICLDPFCETGAEADGAGVSAGNPGLLSLFINSPTSRPGAAGFIPERSDLLNPGTGSMVIPGRGGGPPIKYLRPPGSRKRSGSCQYQSGLCQRSPGASGYHPTYWPHGVG